MPSNMKEYYTLEIVKAIRSSYRARIELMCAIEELPQYTAKLKRSSLEEVRELAEVAQCHSV